jgi:hypothetical protein
MELFVVNNKATGKIAAGGFSSKSDAKAERDRLQKDSTAGLPPIDKRQDQSLWTYSIGPGKDHRISAKS